jgi:DNA-binding LacI/PurR family transcriptional regulator
MARFLNPPLTTVIQDTKLAGETLVDNLIRLIRREPVETLVLPVKLVVRRSSLHSPR